MESQKRIQKIAVIGNVGGGKTTLSRALAKIHNLPLIHVDSVQFIENLQIRPFKESIEILLKYQSQDQWIIDGYGPLDILERRLKEADLIVMIDLPVWRHLWWIALRQCKNIWSPRKELPPGSREVTWDHTMKLFKTFWRAHKQMRPELLRILNRDSLREKVVKVETIAGFKRLMKCEFCILDKKSHG